MEVISKEEFFEIMKTACVDELKSIMAAQREMTKEAGALSQAASKLFGSVGKWATGPWGRRALQYGLPMAVGGGLAATGHPYLGGLVGLGIPALAMGGGALSRLGKVPLAQFDPMAEIAGRVGRGEMTAARAGAAQKFLNDPAAAAAVARQQQQITNEMARRAGPRLGLGAGVGVPVALGGTYLLGKDILGGITGGGDQQGGGGGMGTIPGLAMAGLGGYGGYQLTDMLNSRFGLGLPDWTKWLGTGLGAWAGSNLVGGM